MSATKPSSLRGDNFPSDMSAVSEVSAVGGQSAPQSARNLSHIKSTCDDKSGITYASQHKLPRLPIPLLEETLERFKCRLEALQDMEEQEETDRICDEFLNTDGPILQKALQDYEAEGVEEERIGSYVEEFWNESYLSPDTSVVLNLNPFFVLEDAPDPKIAKDQVRRAASLCYAAIKMASALRHESIAPDVFKGNPLCMDQFRALFASSRQPTLKDSDDVHVYSDSSHVLVLCKNQFYYFTALWPETGHVAVDEADIQDILNAIVKDSDKVDLAERTKTALGVFTSLPRSRWAAARLDLCENETNRMALQIIDSALFVLVLDDYTPRDIHVAAGNVLHGTNELKENETMQVGTCLNRWYDKLQLVVCKDGTSGLIFEHSIIDGHTALRFVSDVYAETLISFAESIVDIVHGSGLVTHVIDAKVQRAATLTIHEEGKTLDVLPKKIVFDLSESMLERIYYAESALCDEIHASDTFVLEFKEYGKRLIVGNKMSPDAFVQMVILLAYYRLYGKVDCMYEPAMTKHFFHGRTEAIRGTTLEAKSLCEIWMDKKSTDVQKMAALRKACAVHSKLTKEAAMGLGVDRHLFAMMCLAEQMGMKKPAFFKSPAWKKLNHTVLSTSNCGNPALRLFGFGPVVPDGFGIGYIIKDYGISFACCSKHRQTRRYVRSLRTVLHDLQKILQPSAKVEVNNQRPGLKNVRDLLIRKDDSFNSYGDFWGENKAIEALKHVDDESSSSVLSAKASFPKEPTGAYFRRVSQRINSLDFLVAGQNSFAIDVAIGEGSSDEASTEPSVGNDNPEEEKKN